jgi:hypothetical protein
MFLNLRKIIFNRIKYNLFEKDKHLYHPEYFTNIYWTINNFCCCTGLVLGIYFSLIVTITEDNIRVQADKNIFYKCLKTGVIWGWLFPIMIPVYTIKVLNNIKQSNKNNC